MIFRVQPSPRNEMMNSPRPRFWLIALISAPAVAALLFGAMCVPGGDGFNQPIYNNVTDKTNRGASYLTSNGCRACHSGFYDTHMRHPHAQALKRVTGGAPAFPPPADGVPVPPDGFAWSDISYMLGGYIKRAVFFDANGYALTTGLTGKNTEWNLPNPPAGTGAQFGPHLPTAAAPTPFDGSSIQSYTTGGMPQDPANPMFQENRPGFLGTWVEPGVQCEACHGPGGNHAPNPGARDLFVDPNGAQTCNACHSRPYGTTSRDILAAEGFVRPLSQAQELAASGYHARFACGLCHESHRSLTYDRENAIRNDCSACHGEMNMALHEGKVFRRASDGYTETLTCISCHMPFATLAGTAAPASLVGPQARVGDTRTHIFRISSENIDYTGFLTPDGTKVRLDAEGMAAVTVDFVCLRCHNEMALPNIPFNVDRASEIAPNVHKVFE